jgi:hypothetical protein
MGMRPKVRASGAPFPYHALLGVAGLTPVA